MIVGHVILALALGSGGDAAYCWPLELPRELTSSFAEYRPGRFHAGIDLRTGGIGQPVHAAADGYISRVRCSPWGYGKAVYLATEDGRTVVYAHLDDYYDVLRAYVRQKQHAARSYTVDLFPNPGEFPVKRAQIVAKSGQTGIGAPHLHFEIRDARQQPIDPRLAGITWPDDQRPVLHKLLAAPRGPESAINGSHAPQVLEVRHLGDGRYACSPIRAKGQVGFGVDVTDPGAGGYQLGIHHMRLLDGGVERFRMQHDSLSYDNHRNAAVSYFPYLLDKGRFLLLCRWPGNVCASYAHSPGDGWFAAPEEQREIRIEVADFAGNEAVLTVPVGPDAGGAAAPPTGPGTGRGRVVLECVGNYLLATARFTAPEPEAPEMLVEGDGSLAGVTFQRLDAQTFEAVYAPSAGGDYTISVMHPRVDPFERRVAAALRGEAGRTVELGGLQMRVEPDSPYGALFASVLTDTSRRAAPIPQHGPAYVILPEDAPIDAVVEVSFPVPEGIQHLERVHVYRLHGAGWVRQDTEHRGDRLSVSTRNFGAYAVMEDDRPPEIKDVSPADGYHAKTRRPIIKASVTDAGSGIATFEVTCSGEWLLAAYDPEHAEIRWERDEDLPPGRQTIVIRVVDSAGNTTTVTRTVLLPS